MPTVMLLHPCKCGTVASSLSGTLLLQSCKARYQCSISVSSLWSSSDPQSLVGLTTLVATQSLVNSRSDHHTMILEQKKAGNTVLAPIQPLQWGKRPRHIVASTTLNNSTSYTSQLHPPFHPTFHPAVPSHTLVQRLATPKCVQWTQDYLPMLHCSTKHTFDAPTSSHAFSMKLPQAHPTMHCIPQLFGQA